MFGAVVSYACPADKSVCYSVNSPETNAQFIDMQAQVNKFAHAAGFTLIAQDGLIGSGTVSATKKALSYVEAHLPDGELKAAVISLQPFAASRQLIASAAQALGDALREAATRLGLTSSGGGGGGGGGGMTVTPVPPITIPPGSLPTSPLGPASGSVFSALSPTTKAVVGVGAAVSLGAIALIFWPKRKKAAGVSGYRRR